MPAGTGRVPSIVVGALGVGYTWAVYGVWRGGVFVEWGLSAVRRVEGGREYRSPVERVWYAAYGSNMHGERLRCYLAGGRPPGGGRTYPGCRDSQEPLRSVAVELAGTVYFATESLVWTGGRAFYDPQAPGRVWGRAHLVTVGQFSDIAAQEMYGAPAGDLDLSGVLAAGCARLGPGRYETLVHAGDMDGFPLLTLTAPWRVTEVPWVEPSAVYLGHLAAGLLEADAWERAAVCRYLATRPGAAGHWTPARVAALLPPPPARGSGTGTDA